MSSSAKSITVERVGDKIHLTGWIGSRTPRMCQEVGAGRFNSDDPKYKHWRYPLSMTTCRRFREVFGANLAIGPALNAWAKLQVQEETLLESIKSLDTVVTLPGVECFAPRIAELAHPYQRAGIAFGARLGTFGLFDQPGLGKTMQTIGAIIERAADSRSHEIRFHLILAPKIAVATVWPGEVLGWGGARSVVFALTGTHENRESVLSAALAAGNNPLLAISHVFVAANIEMVRLTAGVNPDKDADDVALWPELFSIEWETVVVDESHRALVRSKLKGKGMTKPRLTGTRRGMAKLRSRNRIALSGTPMRGKPEQLWGTLNWLRPDVYTSYWNFIGQFFEKESNGFSNYIVGELKDGAEEAMAKSIAPLVLRRTKSEVLTELPPKTYAGTHLIPNDPNSPFGVWLEPSPKHAKQYATFLNDGTVVTDGGEITAVGALAEYTRKSQLASAVHSADGDVLRPVAESCKLDWLLAKIEELGIPNEGRIMVASNFTQLINVFAEAVRAAGIPCHVLTGETSDAKRVQIVADFQSDAPEARVFFINTKAGGVAVTLDMTDDVVMLDETTVPDDQEQVEDRAHRASRMHNVTIHYLRTLGTQDEEIAWISAARENVQKYILDGARGVAYAKALYLSHTEKG